MGRLFAFPVSEIIRPLRGSAGGVGKKKGVILLSSCHWHRRVILFRHIPAVCTRRIRVTSHSTAAMFLLRPLICLALVWYTDHVMLLKNTFHPGWGEGCHRRSPPAYARYYMKIGGGSSTLAVLVD